MTEPENLRPSIEPKMRAAPLQPAPSREIQEAYRPLARYTSPEAVNILKGMFEIGKVADEGTENGQP